MRTFTVPQDIEGENVVLKAITKEHTPLIVKWRNNPSVRQNFIFQETFTEDIHNAWMDSKVASGEVVQFIIYTKPSSTPIGSVYLRDVDLEKQKAEFGIFIGEDIARGQGYGRSAAQLICRYGFEQLHLHKIMLRVFAENKGAIRSYERAGFVQEAYFRDEEKIDGKFHDIIFMAMINDCE
ncbi:MAG: GNAT family N-acetyltransferase [Lachnospiraceae bacterium]|nr:GNAT family N-acetyltransferase [Lachnospiraceae bacterium]